EFKERFRSLPTEAICRRLNTGMLQKEAAIALRELLEERESVEGRRDLSDEAIHAALGEVAPLCDYCLVGGRFGELVYVRNFQGHWGATIIEDDAESRATKDYLRRMGVPVFASEAEWLAWVNRREAEPGAQQTAG